MKGKLFYVAKTFRTASHSLFTTFSSTTHNGDSREKTRRRKCKKGNAMNMQCDDKSLLLLLATTTQSFVLKNNNRQEGSNRTSPEQWTKGDIISIKTEASEGMKIITNFEICA
jgi:hypothetical protein